MTLGTAPPGEWSRAVASCRLTKKAHLTDQRRSDEGISPRFWIGVVIVILVAVFIALNLFSDLLYRLLDPRVRMDA